MTYQKTYPWEASARILSAQPIGDVPPKGMAVTGDLATMIRSALALPARYQNGASIVYGAAYRMGMDEVEGLPRQSGVRDAEA